MLRQISLLTIFVIIGFQSFGQFYIDFPEVKRYENKLHRLDNFLKTNPTNQESYFSELYQQAKSTKNVTLETILDILKGSGFYYSGQSDSAVIYFNKAVSSAVKIHEPSLLSTARIRKIFIISDWTNSDVAYRLVKDEYEIARENKDTLSMMLALNGMSLFSKEDESILKAIELALESNNEYEYGSLLNNLAVSKLDHGDTEGALSDLITCLRIAQDVNDVRLELTVLENLGYYYMEVDSLDLAKKEFQETYEKAARLRHYQIALTSIINLSGLYRELEDFAKSDSLIDIGLQLARDGNSLHFVSYIYLNMAGNELNSSNYTKVNQYLDSVEYYMQYTQNSGVGAGIYQLKYQMAKKRGNADQALEYYIQLMDFQDSVDNNGHVQMITELQLKYDVDQQEKQRENDKRLYEDELAKRELNNLVLKQKIAIGLVLVVIFLAALIIYYFRHKHKKQSEFSLALVNKLEEERGRIARDLHDGLGQSLIILKNKFNNLGMNENSEVSSVDKGFSDTIEEVRSISRTLIPPELRRLGLKKSLLKMLKDIENTTGTIVSSELDDLEDLKLSQPQEIRIYRIIQELINNTLKHAKASSLRVELEKFSNHFTIVYQDNGVGIQSDRVDVKSDSIGLKSIEQRLKILNGSIKYDKPVKGFRAVIKIKIN